MVGQERLMGLNVTPMLRNTAHFQMIYPWIALSRVLIIYI